MKKLLIIALVLVTSTSFSQNFDFGFGAALGTKMKIDNSGTNTGFGVNARGVFSFANKFGVTGGATYFFPNKFDVEGVEYKNSFLIINVDFLFYFLNIPKVKFYALGGLANTIQMYKIDGNSDSENNIGLEFGSGLKAGPLFIEAKYETKAEQFIATVGIYIK